MNRPYWSMSACCAVSSGSASTVQSDARKQ